MSKFVLKLVFSFLLLTGTFLFLSGGHVAALNAGGCGTPPSNPPTTWGNAGVGGSNNQMASITVYANDTNNNPINVNYTLQSYTASGQAEAQIYHYSPALHSYDPGTATQQHTFTTGEYLSGDGGYKCNGWDEIGPGVDGQDGNGYVVNCDDGLGNGTASQFHYFITHIDPPAGQSDSTGSWYVFFQGANLTTNANASPGIRPIVVRNGSNVDVQLVWHQNTWSTSPNSVVKNNSTGQGPSQNVTAQPGDSVTFTHTITTSGDPSSYSWTVLRKYPSDSNPVIARSGNGSGTTNVSIPYNIPSGAQTNQQYCQRITFNNDQGGSPASGGSSFACVTIRAPDHHCSGSCGSSDSYASECSGVNITDGGSVTVGGNTYASNRERTLVNVTDSNGDVLIGGSVTGFPGGFTVVQNGTLNQAYTVNGKSVTIYVFRQYAASLDKNGNPTNWTNIPAGSTDGSGHPLTGDQTRSHNCYAASCTVSASDVAGNVPGGPGNGVLAGSSFQVTVHVSNPGDNTYLPLGEPTVNGTGVDSYWLPLNGGDSGTATLTMTADATVHDQTLNFTIKDSAVKDEGDGLASCSTSVPVYQQFKATVVPHSTLTGGEADARTNVAYDASITQTWVNPPSGMTDHTINNTTSTSFYQKLASGGTAYPCAPSSGGSSPYNSSTGGATSSIWSNPNCSIPGGSFHAGDEYCSTVSATYSGGYVGPDGNVAGGTGPASATPDCPRVTNEPYFKVTNSSIATGGDFDSSACPSPPGVLAGFNNNQDRGYDRGASAQLSVLGLLSTGISGVASGQTVGTIGSGGQGAMGLTFANGAGAPYGGDTDKPTLGGNAGTCQQLTNKSPDKPTSPLGGSTNVSTLASGEYTSGDLQIGAPGTTETMTANHQVEIFATGNVYIGSNIKYDNTGAVPGTVPSLVIHAAGNIYIDPAVANLAGTFIAQKTTSGGTIYTCGTSSFTALPTGGSPNIYNDCHNQLLVYGSFVANQVNLMRTFGSLRDETPVGGTPPVAPGQDTPGASQSLVWSSTGQPPNSKSCVSITPPNAGAALASSWSSANLCLSASETQPVTLGTSSASGANCTGDWGNWLRLNSRAYRQFDAWRTRNLCSNYAISLSKTNDPNLYCTQITNTTSPNNTNGWPSPYVCISQYVAGTPGSSGMAPSFPSPLSCSNAPGANPQVTATGATCAAEVFRFSPEIYLSNPGGACTVNCGGGSTPPPQSITSLPPVL